MFKNKPMFMAGLVLLLVALITLGNFANDYWKYTVAMEYNHNFSRLSAELFWRRDVYYGIAGGVALVAAILVIRRSRKAPLGPDTSDILDQ